MATFSVSRLRIDSHPNTAIAQQKRENIGFRILATTSASMRRLTRSSLHCSFESPAARASSRRSPPTRHQSKPRLTHVSHPHINVANLTFTSRAAPQLPTMSLVAQFLTQINQYVRLQQGDNLRAWLQVEPNSAKSYYDMAAELRAKFNTASGLEAAIDTHLPVDDDVPDGQAAAWPSFQSFMKDYLTLWRDINYDDLLGTHELLTALVK